jgi:hypothetical protein
MGNHQAGHAIVTVALAIAKRRKPDETALDILDEACSEYRGCDAEFDDSCHLGEPFADLLKEAFAPDVGFSDDDDGQEDFYDKVVTPFCKRYELW